MTYPTARPSRVVVVAAMPRSGSNLLVRGLGRAGLVNDPVEHTWEILLGWSVFHQHLPKPRLLQVRLHIGRLWRWWGTSDPRARRVRTTIRARRDYLNLVGRLLTTVDGVLAVKLMWPDYEQAMLIDDLDVNFWGAPVTWIHIWRRDEVRQAVSWWKADQTQQWLSDAPQQAARRSVRYDAQKIAAKVDEVQRGNSGWRQHFAATGVTPIEVVYEDFVADYEGTMRRVLDAVGFAHAEVPEPQIERQSDDTNNEWIARFLAESGSA